MDGRLPSTLRRLRHLGQSSVDLTASVCPSRTVRQRTMLPRLERRHLRYSRLYHAHDEE